MKSVELVFQELVDALQTADNEAAFGRIAKRAAEALGYQRFAYLCVGA